jgi:hypothetical protein
MPQANTTDLPVAELAERLNPARLERDVPLAPYTTFRIGGPADLLYRARTQQELADAVLAARELGVPYFLLGLGANILVGDRGFRGLVIRNEVEGIDFLDDVRVRAGSGAKVLLAYSDTATQQAVLPNAKFTDRALAEVRKRGWAQSAAEREPGVASVSAPVRDAHGVVIAAISVSGPIDRMGRRPGARWAADLLAASEAMTRRL